MHEVSLVHALFDQADAAVAAYPRAAVRQVRVRIGALAGVEPELFRSAFDGSRRERGYPAAELALVWAPARYRCAECGGAMPGPGPSRCLACDGPARLESGGEIVLERIELEVSDV